MPDQDQGSIAEIRANGGILIGKTNTPEFGAGANTRNLVFGATGNPFDPEMSCAGSSGGSAVSLATGMVPLATGSDYGGSLRTPASFCGVVGFRPSPGVVPNELRSVGLNPFSVLGPMGRTVADAALLLSAMIDDDPRDPFGSGIDPELAEPLQPADLASLRVAISEDLGVAPLDNDIRECFRRKTDTIRHIFTDAQDHDPPFDDDLHRAFEVLRCVNYLSAHGEKVENHRDLLTPNVVANVDMAANFTMTDVAWAHAKQTSLYKGYIEMFNEAELLLSPAAAVSPSRTPNGIRKRLTARNCPTMRWMSPAYALTMATPASCVIPFGTDSKGFPMGLQISCPKRLGPIGPGRRGCVGKRARVETRNRPGPAKHPSPEGLDHVQAPVYSMPRNGDAHLGALTYGYPRVRGHLPRPRRGTPGGGQHVRRAPTNLETSGRGQRLAGERRLVRLRDAIGPNQQSNSRSPP